jgi:hypothetical protein
MEFRLTTGFLAAFHCHNYPIVFLIFFHKHAICCHTFNGARIFAAMSTRENGKIILVAKNLERRTHYLNELAKYSLSCCVEDSLHEAVNHAAVEPHCGVLIDIHQMLRFSSSQKTEAEDILNGLPSATANIHAASGTIRIFPRGSLVSACSSLEQFIDVCVSFVPKIIFVRKREPVHFNVLLDIDASFSGAEKTACIDISAGGCFLFCVREDIVIGDTVWIKMPETVRDAPLKAVVCWVRNWGTSQNIPGIGVRFET